MTVPFDTLPMSAVPLPTALVSDTSPSFITTTFYLPVSAWPAVRYRSTYASMIVVDATATTYRLDCTPEKGSDDYPVRVGEFDSGCEDMPSLTFTVGPSTAQVTASEVRDGKQGTYIRNCKVDYCPEAQALCVATADGVFEFETQGTYTYVAFHGGRVCLVLPDYNHHRRIG
ncbi:hypothetical protein V8F20_009838 [Naviculisporaceae sp. PSN 640]